MDEVCLGGLHSEEIGDVGGGEIIHLIVEDYASISEQLGTKERVDCPIGKNKERKSNQ